MDSTQERRLAQTTQSWYGGKSGRELQLPQKFLLKEESISLYLIPIVSSWCVFFFKQFSAHSNTKWVKLFLPKIISLLAFPQNHIFQITFHVCNIDSQFTLFKCHRLFHCKDISKFINLLLTDIWATWVLVCHYCKYVVINIHLEVFLYITRIFKNQFLEELLGQSNEYF